MESFRTEQQKQFTRVSKVLSANCRRFKARQLVNTKIKSQESESSKAK